VIVASAFRPAWWLRGGHAQTLWGALLRRVAPPAVRRERLVLPDGDFIDIDWAGEHGPVVVILHGLGGSVDSHYARGLLDALVRRGWRGALMHFRGCSGEPNLLQRSYHGGDTGDLAFFVEKLRQREPYTPLAAVGYSLGGNVLLKWLGEQGAAAPLQGAAAVSVPFDLGAATAHLMRGFARVYEQRLLRCLQEGLADKRARMTLPLPAVEPAAIASLRAFDEHITAPLHGFRDADDYYARASCFSYLSHIAVPTLIVHALDDPFMPPAVIPRAEQLSSHIRLELSASGGHVGFIGGTPWSPRFWLEERIPEHLAPLLAVDR